MKAESARPTRRAQARSSTKIYVAWLTCFGALVTLVAVFPRSAGYFVVAYSFAVSSAAALMTDPPTARLLEYFRRHHHEQWARLVFFPNSAQGWNGPNSMAILQFLFTRDQLNDPVLASLKEEAKARYFFLVLIIIHLPVLWIASGIFLS